MSEAPHHAPLLRTLALALAEPPAPEAIERLRAIPGMDSATAEKERLFLSYDIRRLTLAELKPRLAEAGIRPSAAWTARLARALAAFKDENQRDQSKLVHQCCSLPPDKR